MVRCIRGQADRRELWPTRSAIVESLVPLFLQFLSNSLNGSLDALLSFFQPARGQGIRWRQRTRFANLDNCFQPKRSPRLCQSGGINGAFPTQRPGNDNRRRLLNAALLENGQRV